MACLGVFFALEDAITLQLRRARSEVELMEVIETVEERWDKQWLFETDKAWDALHRSLTNGTLDSGEGDNPLDAAVLGGAKLYHTQGYFVSLKTPAQCAAIAHALSAVDEEALRARYFQIEKENFDGVLTENDFQYTWQNGFVGLATFYQRAALAGRHVVFSVDQ